MKPPADRRTRVTRVSSLVALAVLASLAVAACKSDEKPKAEKPPPFKDRSLLDRGRALGNSAKDRALSAGSRGLELGKSLIGKGASWSSLSRDETKRLGERIVEEAGENSLAARSRVNRLLDRIARDPTKKVSPTDRVGRMIVLMIPLVGPTKRYADARKLYELGAASKDAAMMQRARREVLVAFIEAGLDIGALGLVGSRMDLVATGANRLLTILKVSRTVSVLAGDDRRTFDTLLDKLLAFDDIRSSVDRALTSNLGR